MDYEQKYKKAFKVAENIHRFSSDPAEIKRMEEIFPELKESEDERIRKSLLEYLHTLPNHYSHSGVCVPEWIAWIEKQDKNKDILEDAILDSNENGLIAETLRYKKEKQGNLTIRFFTDEFEWALGRIIAFWNQNHKDGKYDENELMSYIKVRETELVKLFTDNVCKVSLSDCTEEYRKAYYDGYNKCNRDWLKIKDISVDEYNKNAEILLGGQGEQKPIIKMKTPEESLGIDSDTYNKIVDECIYDEQKPADKVELKFKVGDKIQYLKGCGTIMTIEKIENDEYVFANGMGRTTIESGNKWHLVEPAWSEEDESRITVICTYLQDYARLSGSESRTIRINEYCDWLKSFKDRVQPQPRKEWSEEDETMITDLSIIVHTYFSEISGIPFKYDLSEDKIRNWLISLKDRVQPRQEWSEEDKENFELAIYLLEKAKEDAPDGLGDEQGLDVTDYKNVIKWLKSLRPQNTWKPSDEQMEVLLSEANAWTKGCPKQKILKSLYNELKKLREE